MSRLFDNLSREYKKKIFMVRKTLKNNKNTIKYFFINFFIYNEKIYFYFFALSFLFLFLFV